MLTLWSTSLNYIYRRESSVINSNEDTNVNKKIELSLLMIV